MQMTESEIKTNIMQAKDQIAQIPICAQLNGVSIDTIKDILRKQGVDLRTLKGPAGRKGWKVVPVEPTPDPDAVPSSDKIILQLFERVNDLTAQREAITSELFTIKAELVKMLSVISKGEDNGKTD